MQVGFDPDFKILSFLLRPLPPFDLGSGRLVGLGEQRGLGGRLKQRLGSRDHESSRLQPSTDALISVRLQSSVTWGRSFPLLGLLAGPPFLHSCHRGQLLDRKPLRASSSLVFGVSNDLVFTSLRHHRSNT